MIVTLQHEFAQAFATLLQKAQELGYQVTLGETYRTPEQASWDALHGSGIKDSLHINRLAGDIQLFKDGRYIEDSEGYEDLGAWWKTLGKNYCWGGDFARRDYDHFSISPDGRRK